MEALERERSVRLMYSSWKPETRLPLSQWLLGWAPTSSRQSCRSLPRVNC
jgi:hypothetical protein